MLAGTPRGCYPNTSQCWCQNRHRKRGGGDHEPGNAISQARGDHTNTTAIRLPLREQTDKGATRSRASPSDTPQLGVQQERVELSSDKPSAISKSHSDPLPPAAPEDLPQTTLSHPTALSGQPGLQADRKQNPKLPSRACSFSFGSCATSAEHPFATG